jgi:hypothetical protein
MPILLKACERDGKFAVYKMIATSRTTPQEMSGRVREKDLGGPEHNIDSQFFTQPSQENPLIIPQQEPMNIDTTPQAYAVNISTTGIAKDSRPSVKSTKTRWPHDNNMR